MGNTLGAPGLVMNEFAYLGRLAREDQADAPDLVALSPSLLISETPTSPLYRRHISPDRELQAFVSARFGG